jgi:hypothetical protein
MLEDGLESGEDLVKCMQPREDLKNTWLMFDHVKRVQSWTTREVYHAYNATYCKVMTIVVCDMKSEDTKMQCMMWRKFKKVMRTIDVEKPNLKGFMGDYAQAKWNAICIVYGSGDPKVSMENQKHACLLYWTTSLQ